MIKVKIMAGILSTILAFFGLSGCKQEDLELQILDGPSMIALEPYTYALGNWTLEDKNQYLVVTEETIELKENDKIVWSGEWELGGLDGIAAALKAKNGELMGDYEYFIIRYSGWDVEGLKADRESDEQTVEFKPDFGY